MVDAEARVEWGHADHEVVEELVRQGMPADLAYDEVARLAELKARSDLGRLRQRAFAFLGLALLGGVLLASQGARSFGVAGVVVGLAGGCFTLGHWVWLRTRTRE